MWWMYDRKRVQLLAISSNHYDVYTNVLINYFKIKLDNSFLKQNFIKILTTHLNHNLKDAGYFICVSIKSFNKSFLKHIWNYVYDFLSSKADSFPNQLWHEITSDLIKSRIYNPPASKTNENKKQKNKITFCRQKHGHDKH